MPSSAGGERWSSSHSSSTPTITADKASFNTSCESTNCSCEKPSTITLTTMLSTDDLRIRKITFIPQFKTFHLWNWRLCQHCRVIPSKVRQSSTFGISVHPKTFIKLAFVRVVNLSSPALPPFSPAAFIPIAICLHMRHIINFNPLSTLNHNRFQSQSPGTFSHHSE